MKCAKCNKKLCVDGKDCKKEITEKVIKEYEKDENLKMARVSSFIEGTYYMKKNKIGRNYRILQINGIQKNWNCFLHWIGK